MRTNAAPTAKLWDGRRRTTTEWDGLHREPELWAANGNCLVYLYGKGQCNAGASFRIDFTALIRARCYGFIEKYMDNQGHTSDLPKTDADWNRLRPRRMVSLYVPAAARSTRSEVARQHISIRNFLAWVLGLPLVGEHLGGEIVTLFQSMVGYRPLVADSTPDLLAYLDFAGYLNVVAQPSHALAILYFAESLCLRELYSRAFVHCVGMGDRMDQSSEYIKISLASRQLIRTANQKLNTKLSAAIEDLRSFLDDEFSESRMRLPRDTRAHLDRFRSALLTFYAAKFGSFPPSNFDSKIVQAMLEDFEALYDLLVDDGIGAPGKSGGSNGGGLCILQIIRGFDSRNSFETRPHPMPLLPDTSGLRTRRMSWLGCGETKKASDRLVAHTALINASNWRDSKNDLVRMYRDFEGTLLDPSAKGDKSNISVTDGRKVRWILIYAMCQVLRSISQTAPQVAGEQAPYFLSAPIEPPPWDTALDTLNTTMELPIRVSALPTMPPPTNEPWQPKFADEVEIKPDIDYFALTHSVEPQQPTKLARRQSILGQTTSSPTRRPSAKLVKKPALERRSTIRDSIKRRLRPESVTSITSATASSSTYHEIVIEGYGNGTNEVKLGRRNTVGCDNSEAALWSPETSPRVQRRTVTGYPGVAPASSQSRSSSHRSSSVSFIDATHSQAASGPASPATIATDEFEHHHPAVEPIIVRNSSHRSLTHRYPMKAVLDTIGRTSSKRRASFSGNKEAPVPPVAPQTAGTPSRASSIRKSLLPESWSLPGRAMDIYEEDEVVTLQSEADEWIAMQAFLDGDHLRTHMDDVAAVPGWEQYNDLGGLTEVR